jgi:hypothetical protein
MVSFDIPFASSSLEIELGDAASVVAETGTK